MRRWLREAALVPLLALLGAELLVMASALASGVGPLRGSSYARWDSHNYISIARRGYYLEEEGGHVVGGNAAWFPGYPLLMRALASRRLTPAKAGRIISTLFALLLLVSLWQAIRRGDGARAPALTLLLGAVFPGFIYEHAVFPLSMVTSLAVLSILLWSRGQRLAAGCAGAAAAFTYPPGCVVGAVLLLAALRDPGLSTRDRLLAVLKGPVLVGVGFLSVFLYQAPAIGWNGFWRMQVEYFENTPSTPLASFLKQITPLFTSLGPESLPAFQTLLVAVLMAASGVVCWRERGSVAPVEGQLALGAALFWVFPYLLGSGIAHYRSEALVVGIVPLLGRLPVVARALLLLVLAALGAGMCMLFFREILV